MKRFKFKKIDAFAAAGSLGNPAGYVMLDQAGAISDKEMLQMARELKGFVNEVGYVVPLKPDVFGLRFFSSEREVDFCGHATIGIMYDLISNTPGLREADFIKITTNRGELLVENRLQHEEAVFIMAPEPVEAPLLTDAGVIAQKLKIPRSAIDVRWPLKVVNAGLSTLLVPLKDLDTTLSIAPDLEALKAFCFHIGVDIITVFTSEVHDGSNDFRTRVFAPTFGYIEDPATGSGNAALGYYLLERGWWQQGLISIEQNGCLEGSNHLKLLKKMADNGVERVWFGGGAITRIEGEYLLA